MFTTLYANLRDRAVILALVLGLLATCWPAAPAAAQGAASASRPEYATLKAKTEQRFQVLVTRQSLVLVPRAAIKGVTNIELSDGLVLIDGNAVTGKELKAVLGGDTETVVQLSFLDAAVRRQLFEPVKAGAPARDAAEAETPSRTAPSAGKPRSDVSDSTIVVTDEWAIGGRSRKGGARVRIAGDVRVGENEQVPNDVVAILGSALIDGAVNGEVVAVGGNVKLGPKALVTGSVTSVGGAIERASGSRIDGEINEVRVTVPNMRPYTHFVAPWRGWTWLSSPFGASVELAGTLVRISIVGLLAVLLVALMPGKVQGVSDRIAAEPWRAAFTGLAAQILFVPLLVLTCVVLAVSIVGIPLLLLVPFVVLGVMVAGLVGFAGTGYAIGERLAHRREQGLGSLIVPLLVGLAVIWAFTVVARFVGLAGGPIRYIVSGVLVVGFIVEYVAWTIGFGGVLLSRFGRRQPAPAYPGTPVDASRGTSFEPPPLEREETPPPGQPPVPGL